MKIIVCEDIREDRDALVFFIKRFFNEINCPAKITVYENGGSFLSALTDLNAGDIKIAFLDILFAAARGIGL